MLPLPGGECVLSCVFCLEVVLCCFIRLNSWQWEWGRRGERAILSSVLNVFETVEGESCSK